MNKLKPLREFEGYFVSSIGQIFSNKRSGYGKKEYPLKLLTSNPDKDGYLVVTLTILGKSVRRRVHRLVAEAFIPNPKNSPCVCHKDDNPANNKVENLWWGTHKENMQDKIQKKRSNNAKGEGNHSKLTKEQILEIRDSKELHRILAEKYGVGRSTITKIKNRKIWKHL